MKRGKNRKKSILLAQIHTAAKAFLIWAKIAISDLSASVVLLLPGPATKRIQIELRKQHRTEKKIFYNQACEFQKNNPETQYFSKYFLFLWFKIKDCLSTLTPEGLKIVKLAAEPLCFKFSNEKDSAQFGNVEANTTLNPGASLKSENPHFSLIRLFSPGWQANLSPG